MRVIKHGEKEFMWICERCGCQFAYTTEDISGDGYVECPDCGHHHNHKWLPDQITWPDYLPVQPIRYPEYPPTISVYIAPVYPYWKTTTGSVIGLSTEYTYTKEDE